MKRMTPEQPARAEIYSPQGTMLLNCFERILGTSRSEPARGRHNRRDQQLVASNEYYEDPSHLHFSRNFKKSASNSLKPASISAPFTLITISTPAAMRHLFFRNTSRTNLRQRLRTTEFPIFRVTVIPILASEVLLGLTNAVKKRA
jgi:hypothetical protein